MEKQKPQLVLRVKNLHSSISFYTENFNWTVEWHDQGKELAQLRLPAGEAVILTDDFDIDVEPFTDVAFEEPKPGNRFYLLGESVKDLKKQLEEKGILDVELEVDPGFGQLLLVPDPDGYIISHWEELYMPDEEIISLYKEGPDKLEGLLKGLTDNQLDLVRAEGKWSIRQTVLHLIDSDLTTFSRLKFALAEPGRDYKQYPYDPNKWESGTQYSQRPIHTEVALFKLVRQHILQLCDHLPNALDRAVNTDQGEVTVRKMMKMVAGHARGHMEQIEETRRVHHIDI